MRGLSPLFNVFRQISGEISQNILAQILEMGARPQNKKRNRRKAEIQNDREKCPLFEMGQRVLLYKHFRKRRREVRRVAGIEAKIF